MVEDTFAPRAAAEREASPLVLELAAELEAAGVAYLHWKGTAFLERTLTGADDLDLLVRRADADSFEQALRRLRFKEARARSSQIPGVTHFYGYDARADTIVHVHAYYQLIVGHDLTENYRLPLEDALLTSSVRGGTVPVPMPELELIVFVLRKVVESCTWDAVALGSRRLPAKSRRELDFLRARADRALVDQLLEQHLPFLDVGLFARCEHALEPDAPLLGRLRAGRRLVASLAPYAREPRAVDVGRKVARRLRPAGQSGKEISSGGAVIAVVGADGAGKSTAVESLVQWLSNDFETSKMHLGKPPWSRTTFMIRGCLKALSIIRSPRRRERSADDRPRAATLLALTTARDRYRAFSRARQLSLAGGLVICDRFPLPQLTLMDGPRIERTVGTRGRISSAMSHLERRYYRALGAPDVLIVLRVDPDVAVERQPGDDPDYVRNRWSEIWDHDWEQLGFHVVDAGRSREEVLSELKSLVWAQL